jgi:hypothetical protein
MNTKYTKSLVLAGAMAIASLADAAQYVYLSGSTAARSIVYNTIINGATVFDAAPTVVVQGGKSLSGANYMNFHGNVGGNDTILKCHWSGSEAGIADLVGGTELFLTDTATTILDGTSPDATVSSPVDLAMADNAKNYSRNPSVAATGAKVGIIAFKWVAEKGSAASLTGVTDQSIRAAFAGTAKLALFTGNPADTTRVFVTGRDSGSGTRVNAYGTCGFGIFSAPSQLQVNLDGSMVDQGGGVYLGDYGYSSGGTVAAQMGYDLTQATSKDVAPLGDGASHFSVIAYLGAADANTAVANGGTALTYNGVPFSLGAIEEGQYNYWGNEYIYKKNNGLSTQAGTVFTKLSTGIPANADNNTLIGTSSMHCTRGGPTSDPVHN